MMFMTAKVDLKKILMIIGAAAAVIIALIILLGGKDAAQTSAPSVSANSGRVKFLKDFGWEVEETAVESGQVKIPEEITEVYERYNNLQKSQGFDLSTYAGKNVMRYVYQIKNYPNASDPVYATLLVYKNKIIGGDITNTAAKGRVHGFKMPDELHTESTAQEPSASGDISLPKS